MSAHGVSFSILSHAAWAPGMDSPGAWTAWAALPDAPPISQAGHDAPGVPDMPPMLRRRAGFLGKMALQVAYQCMAGRRDVPTVFCSRHGEVARAIDLLNDLASGTPLSPTGFGMAVHNASAGLFSIARSDTANHLALAAGAATVEHAVIEACSLLADGAPMVLLVAYDTSLPAMFSQFEDCAEQPHAFAWLMVPADAEPLHLRWTGLTDERQHGADENGDNPCHLPGSLQVLRFQVGGARSLIRVVDQRRWHWSRDA